MCVLGSQTVFAVVPDGTDLNIEPMPAVNLSGESETPKLPTREEAYFNEVNTTEPQGVGSYNPTNRLNPEDRDVSGTQVSGINDPLKITNAPPSPVRVTAPKDFKGLVGIVTGLISIMVPFIFALTILTIMWGVIKAWIIQGGDEKGVDSGKQIALVGIIALIIMSAVWGIVALLKNSFFGS